MLKITFAHRLALLNGSIEERLRKGRLVSFIVAEPAIAVHINDHIAFERLAEINRELNYLRDRFGILAIDVEDWNRKHPRHVRRIRRGAAFARAGGEPELIVQHHVKCAADGISAELAEVQCLLHNALARERGIAMDQEREAALSLLVLSAILFRPNRSEEHTSELP